MMKHEFINLKKQGYRFHIIAELQQIEKLISNLPEKDEIHFFISSGNFSSIGFIKFIAERTKINKLSISTLRVGKKHLRVLDVLKEQGKLNKVDFIIGSIMKQDSKIGKSYGYYDNLLAVCRKNDWTVTVANNHSKIINFDTDSGKYVIWTSSNLNENPKIEQFIFLKNDEIYQLGEKEFFQKMLEEGRILEKTN